MSLFDDASLVLIPDGAKDGKLYSVKPTDGTGDFTFTRGSNLAATRVDENGLIEKGRENIALHSDWDDVGTGVAPTGWATYDPTFEAGDEVGQIRFNPTSSRGYIYQSLSISTGIYAFSVYCDSAPVGNTISSIMAMYGVTNTEILWLEDGVSIDNGTIISAGKRYTSVFNVTSSGTAIIRIGAGTTGNTTADFTLSRPQLEQGLVATDYIETGASTAQAGILEDLPRIDYSGGASCPALLLEPQRTNVAVSSEIFNAATGSSIVLNNTASPDGYVSADKLVEDTSTGVHLTTVGGFLGGSVDSSLYTVSVFAKAAGRTRIQFFDNNQSSGGISAFDLANGVVISGSGKIENYGNGWYRCIIFAVKDNSTTSNCQIRLISTGTTTSYTGDGTSGVFLWGKQIEAGSYPTSYIPTYGSSVTRSIDTGSLNLVGAGINDGWTSGTIFIEFEKPYNNENTDAIRIRGDSLFGRAYIYNNGYGFATDWSYSSNFTIGDNTKIIYRLNTLSTANLFKNGVKLAGAEGSGTAWSDIKYIYLNNQGGAKINIKQIVVFPTALTDSECIALTTL